MSAILKISEHTHRAMTRLDVERVMKIETRAYRFPWSEGIFRDCLRVGYSCWVSEIDYRICAYAVMSLVVNECHILNLCVDPDDQGKGLGRSLLQKMLDIAGQNKVDTVLLEVRPSNTAAVNLYYSEGFNELGRRQDYYPNGNSREDALILAKSIIR